MKILSNKEYNRIQEEIHKLVNENIRLSCDKDYINKLNDINEIIIEKVDKELRDLKSQIVGNISNNRLKNKIDKIIKIYGGK